MQYTTMGHLAKKLHQQRAATVRRCARCGRQGALSGRVGQFGPRWRRHTCRLHEKKDGRVVKPQSTSEQQQQQHRDRLESQ